MAGEARVKVCCDEAYPLHDLFCAQCGEALEETHYRLWIVVTTVVAAATVWLLAHSDVLVKFRWPDVLILEVFLLQIAYPAAKAFQKMRDPERPVLREMASVFADRWSRVLFIAAWVFIAMIWLRVVPRSTVAGHNLVDPSMLPLRTAISTVSFAGFAVTSALVLVDQGPRFFDLRSSNTASPRRR